MDKRFKIAKRVAQEFKNGDVVNLGIGIPTLVSNYIAEDVKVLLHSENGFTGLGSAEGADDADLTNAGGQMVQVNAGAAMFDSALSFTIVRGGHLDATVLGALQVDEQGNLANWMVPGKIVPGMGGAMDLVVGAKRVIVAMEHVGKDGKPKIMKQCTLPLTACGEVDLIITDYGVFSVTKQGLVLQEKALDISFETIRAGTEADYIISPDIKEL